MESELIKNEVLNILKNFDSFCRNNDIKYVLAYGTLIGAIRHKGFIPWDDDIDVVLLADDYNKLRKLTASNPFLDDKNRYKICFPGDDDYCFPYVKVIDTKYVVHVRNVADKYNIGLFIDVFKADNWPNNKINEFYQLQKGKFLRRINEICLRGNIEDNRYRILDILLKPVDLLFKCLGITSEKICVIMDNIASNNKPSNYVGCISEGTGWANEKFERSMYTDTVMVPFEDGMYPAPTAYDRYLRTFYGDYMKLPDPRDRVGHQHEIIQIKE